MHTAKDAGVTTATATPAGAADIWFAEDAQTDKDKTAEIVTACLKAGVNLIDTSHWYGQGRSERLLGHALTSIPRDAYYIMTKVGRYDKDLLQMFDFSYSKTYQAGKDSLKRLRCGVIDSLQVHDPEFAPSCECPIPARLAVFAGEALNSPCALHPVTLTTVPLQMRSS